MKTLKKSLAMLLALVMSLGCMSVGAWATDEIIDDASIETAIESAASGDVIDVPAGNYQIAATIVIPAGVTIKGAGSDKTTLTITTTNGDGVKIKNQNVMISDMTIDGSNITSSGYNSLINVEADGVVIEDVIMTGGGRSTWNSSILVETLTSEQTFTVRDSTISGSFRGVLRESCSANIVIDNCDITATYPFNIDGGNGGTVTVTDGALHGWTSYSSVDYVTFTNVAFSKGYDCVAAYVDTTFTNCTFDEEFDAYAQTSPFTWKFLGCEKNGAPLTKDNFTSQFTDSNVWMKCTLIVDDAMYVKTGDESGEWRTIVAQIGNEYYTTLAEAIAAAQDGDTITLLKDVDITAVLEVTKSLTIEGGNHTVSVNATRGLRVEKNNVALTLKDITFSGLNNQMERGVQVDGGKTGVTLNLDRCRIENCTYYAVNVCNYVTGLTLNIDNSYIAGWGAVNLWGEGYHVNIKDSTLVGYNDKVHNADGWNDFGTVILEGDTTGQTTEHSESCTVVLENCKVIASTSGQGNHQYAFTFNNPSAYNTVTVRGSETVVEVENGADYIAGISGEDNVLNIFSGTFDQDPRGYLNEGYAAVKQDNGTWKVGPVSSASTEIITTGKDTYTVTTTVKESDAANAATLQQSSASVAVASITEEAITADEALDTKTTDTVSLANVDTKKVAEAAAAQVAADNVEGANTIEVTVSLSKTADDTTNLITTSETGEVFEVHPVATYVVKDESGNEIEDAGGTIDVANTTVGSFTFKLYLGSGFTSGQLVTVEHYGDGDDQEPTETWNKKVQSDDDGLYVELTLSSFSHVAVKAAAEGETVDYTVKIADATSGTAVIYPGDSVTMNVTVSGDDFYGGDFTIEYNNDAFEKVEESFAAGINPQNPRLDYESADSRLNYNLVKDGARLADGSTLFSVIFKAKDTLNATATYNFKVVDARVNYDTNKNADIVDCDEDGTFVTNDKVTVNATQYTVKFDGESHDWEYSVYEGKGVDTIPTDVQTGYTFKGWALAQDATTALTADAIRNAAVTADVTYYSVFEAEQYNVTLSGTTTDNEPAKATFGQDYTATISDYDANNYDYTVTYKSGTDASKTLDLSAESNFNAETGAFTIPAADITGELKVTVEKTLKGFEVELHADYVTGYTLVLVRAASDNTTDPIYTYDNGPMFFVNARDYMGENNTVVSHYGAYAILVEGAITESAACAKVGITATPAETLTISEDVNAASETPLVDSSDLQAAFSGYKAQLTLPEQMAIYLRADVNGDYKLDTADVGLINNARTQ